MDKAMSILYLTTVTIKTVFSVKTYSPVYGRYVHSMLINICPTSLIVFSFDPARKHVCHLSVLMPSYCKLW